MSNGQRTTDIDPIRLANAGGFWGDDPGAPLRVAQTTPDLDVLTIDYLAEVSLSILAKQRDRGGPGFPKDVPAMIASLAPIWQSGRDLTVVTNGGGLDPVGCRDAAAQALREAGVRDVTLTAMVGDDVLDHLRASPDAEHFRHLDTGASLTPVLDHLVTANAYVGANDASLALYDGADVLLTGRMADPSMVVAPCLSRWWSSDDWDRLAGATVAGHLIECGQQVCGGIATDWLDLPDHDCGYPVVEVHRDGSCVVTKPTGTGGRVDTLTVREQLLYELGDPGNYLSPDCTVRFDTLKVEHIAEDRVRVSGASGSPPPEMLKVNATYRAGWRCVGALTVLGVRATEKAQAAGELVLRRLHRDNRPAAHEKVEVVGGDDACVLRIGIRDDDRDLCERFSRLIAPLVTGGPPGTTGYADGRPPVREVFGYWPCLIPRDRVHLEAKAVTI
jgi:hypothetical protein